MNMDEKNIVQDSKIEYRQGKTELIDSCIKNNTTIINVLKKCLYGICARNITELDLSNRGISCFDDSLLFSTGLKSLNLSNNSLKCLPKAVLTLHFLNYLDVSNNKIEYFTEIPCFAPNIKHLNLENNKLKKPPLWIWTIYPVNIVYLNLQGNRYLFENFKTYIDALSVGELNVSSMEISHCQMGSESSKIFKTLPSLRKLILGGEYNTNSNTFLDFPTPALLSCAQIETVIVSNVRMFNVNEKIYHLLNLKEIDLSGNNLKWLPENFGKLINLERCAISYCKLMMLPDSFVKLRKLRYLSLDNNELNTLPKNFFKCIKLDHLDLYNIYLTEISDAAESIVSVDLGQNFFWEPSTECYKMNKSTLRSKLNVQRWDGNRIGDEKKDHLEHKTNSNEDFSSSRPFVALSSLPEMELTEDWDSDEYWEPSLYTVPKKSSYPRHQSVWEYYVLRSMADGKFCPADLHQVPIYTGLEPVKYDGFTCQGQFDDD